MKKYKKYFIIIVPIILLIILLSIVNFKLIGEDDVIIEYGAEYVDSGFVSKTLFDKDLSDSVTIQNNVDTETIGDYQVIYELKYLWIKKKIVRNVHVDSNGIDSFDIILNGGDKIYQNLHEEYEELGGYVINRGTKEKIYNKLSIKGKVNVNALGENELIYVFEHDGEKKEKIRKVIVYNFKHNGNDVITDKEKNVHIKIEGIDNYLGVETPKRNIIKDNEFDYLIAENGEYNFIIYTNDKEEIKYTLTIDSIIHDYTCQGTISRDGTKIEVVSNKLSDIKSYKWLIDGKEEIGNNIYQNNKSIKDGKVELTFKDGKTFTANCEIEDKLVYHFEYDENNTKPFMKCNTYTAQDRIELNSKLSQAVAAAGYGTRAGVVEAARFLVGALKYKVPYVGASRYNEKGLNIGQSKAWGCSGVGLDCFYFVYWALSQNGLPLGALYSGTKLKTREVIDQIRVGDYIYTPCYDGSNCKNKYEINHIGLIIGIDEKNIYVAESTTGNVNAVIVSKWDKYNMPEKGKFSVVRLIDYPSEGNVTNMWVE